MFLRKPDSDWAVRKCVRAIIANKDRPLVHSLTIAPLIILMILFTQETRYASQFKFFQNTVDQGCQSQTRGGPPEDFGLEGGPLDWYGIAINILKHRTVYYDQGRELIDCIFHTHDVIIYCAVSDTSVDSSIASEKLLKFTDLSLNMELKLSWSPWFHLKTCSPYEEETSTEVRWIRSPELINSAGLRSQYPIKTTDWLTGIIPM